MQNLMDWCLDRQGTGTQKGIMAAVGVGMVNHIWRQRNLSRNERQLLMPRKVVDQLFTKIRHCISRRDDTTRTMHDNEWLRRIRLL
ncbi:hypothetical protein vseg_006217 [Gypsophila vaccaria]